MKKKKFEEPFIGIREEKPGYNIVYSKTGSLSVIMRITNLCCQYSADPEFYETYHFLLGQIIKLLGDGYVLQKTDIIASQKFGYRKEGLHDYLSKKYFKHFENRIYKELTTYLTITKDAPKKGFLTYNPGDLKSCIDKISKVIDLFNTHKISCKLLQKSEIEALYNRYIAFNFGDKQFSSGNFKCDEKAIYYQDKTVKSISLIDIDEINLPSTVSTFTTSQEIGKTFPIDNLSFLFNVNTDTILYNQVVKIPDQRKLKMELELKKKRHKSMPDPANDLSVADIEDMFLDIAQNNELLVYAHYNILVSDTPSKIEKSVNVIESSLFSMGIIPGKNTYNQMELFRSAIPGNSEELKDYDLFLTSRPAAICFFLKETLPKSEDSKYQLWFTDRQGVPIGIDTSEMPMYQGRISNRNRFILGPSGSGKSFFTNSYAKQCKEHGADIVLVDTGNSYYGLCKYFKGKYITYTEKQPITMNPFKIELIENNEEKRQILKELIGLIWKGVDGKLSQVEDDILTKSVTNYYRDFFGKGERVKSLSFNSFYEFSCAEISHIMEEEKVKFEIDEYKFILRKFYKGGIYEKILNDEFDNSLFNESFIVFEIDNIKEHKLLFPITTLIIMDVFIQKMRHKKNKKVLIIEEAWKAIASPMMAGYILYLYKTVRKFAGEAIVVTQELNDIIGNAIVKDSIISNSDTVCLLDQTKFKDNFSQIAQLLSLNEVECNKIFTINRLDNRDNRGRFKEVYIKRGAIGEVYGVEVPLEEYLTYTTERSEKEALEIYLEAFENYEEAMDHFVADLHQSKLSLPEFVKIVNQKEGIYNQLKSVV